MRILHLEDNRDDAELIRTIIAEEWPECEVRVASDRQSFEAELRGPPCDLVLSDFTMAAFSGLEALKLAKAQWPATPFIFLSGTIGEDRAIEALRAGAQDYVLKERMKRLSAAIRRALHESEEHRQRLRAESQLREQAEMLNQSREAIIIVGLDDRVLYWNAGAERLYGWTTREALAQPVRQLLAPAADQSALFENAVKHTEAEGSWQGELRLQHRHGGLLVVDMRQTLIADERGWPKARLCLGSDITERKRLEEQFLRVQRLENIGLLAAGIAHDLNNVLAPILMGAPLLREYVTQPGGLSLLETLEKSAERGAGLVRQILAFAQGVGGEPQLMQARHVLNDLLLFLVATLPKNIQIEDNIPAKLWLIKANPTQIHQILLNLCVNARDAMPRGGTLRLRAENCVLDDTTAHGIAGARPGAFLVLHVEDTGTGIPPDVIARIWEPFVTTKAAGKGTGLGLSTVRGIVQNLSGFVQVVTQRAQGTTFRVYLPAAEAGADLPPHTALSHVPCGRGELILVVDDEPPIRHIIAALLTRQGYRALVAADGVEAVRIFGRHASEIRLVISDIQMPHLDGVTMARVLHRINPALKMLVVSGAVPAAVTEAFRSHPDFSAPLLNKPFVPEVLLAKVHELLHPPPVTA